MKTQSETLFESFCNEHGVKYDSVVVGGERTPDYDVYFDGHQVIVEIKQVEPNDEDRAQLANLEAGGVALFGGEAGKKVRQLITNAKTQLRKRAKGRFPALLVLYNTAPTIHYLDPMFVLLAMYGEMRAHIVAPSDGGQPFVNSMSFGGKRMVTEEHNTTLSAVCVLIEDPEGRPTLTFYHNRFAAIPFEPKWFRPERAKHYVLPETSSNEFGFWTSAA